MSIIDDKALRLTRVRDAGAAFQRLAPGLLLAVTIAMAATFVGDHYGGPVMLYALLFGMAFNFLEEDEKSAPGVAFASKSVLRVGVALLGARLTVGEVADLGPMTVALVLAGVAFTIFVGWFVGRAFKLSSDHAVLSAGAVAICGASAALAISSVLPKHENSERNTILTVVGVTTLSTIAMVLYPIIAQSLGFDEKQAGVFLGATIHDVAQVVGAGYMISDTAGETATVIKLMRVACLVPVVMMIAIFFRTRRAADEAGDAPPVLPAFLIAFLVLMGINSAGLVPAGLAAGLSDISRWCLVAAVAALGVKTSLKNVLAVGPQPIAVLVAQTVMLAVFALAGVYIIATVTAG
ncbi:MAG: YeiH family protein [Pseudomonadota bacterium]